MPVLTVCSVGARPLWRVHSRCSPERRRPAIRSAAHKRASPQTAALQHPQHNVPRQHSPGCAARPPCTLAAWSQRPLGSASAAAPSLHRWAEMLYAHLLRRRRARLAQRNALANVALAAARQLGLLHTVRTANPTIYPQPYPYCSGRRARGGRAAQRARAWPSAMRSLMSRSRSRVSLDFFTPCASRASSRRSRSRSRLRSSLRAPCCPHACVPRSSTSAFHTRCSAAGWRRPCAVLERPPVLRFLDRQARRRVPLLPRRHTVCFCGVVHRWRASQLAHIVPTVVAPARRSRACDEEAGRRVDECAARSTALQLRDDA